MGKNVEQVEQKLLKVVSAEFKVDVHHWLILHGRYACIARKPAVEVVSLNTFANFEIRLNSQVSIVTGLQIYLTVCITTIAVICPSNLY